MPIFNFGFSRNDPAGPPVPLPAALAEAGPITPVEVHVPQELAQLLESQGQPVPPPQTGFVLIDTGATRSCADVTIMTALGVSAVGQVNLGTAGGRVPAPLYPDRFVIGPDTPSPINIDFSSVIGVDLSGQSPVGQRLIGLIGRDMLSRGILIDNGTLGSFSLAIG
jgi:hypothetical protein